MEQYVTRSFTSRTASASRSACSRGVLRIWNASRCALFGPIPGRRWSSSMRRTRGSGNDMKDGSQTKQGERKGPFNSQLQPWRQHAAHLLGHLLIDFALGVIDRCNDQILKHLDVVFRNDFGIDRERLHLLGAVDDDRDHSAARIALDLQLGHLFLQAILHLLGLLHHLLNVHHISSTSRISAGNTSSSAWTPASASACSRSADFLSTAAVAAAASPAG